MIVVYVSENPDGNSFQSVEVPSIELARSVVRGLLASPSAFVFRGLGWFCVRGGFGASPDWFPDTERWGSWSWPVGYEC